MSRVSFGTAFRIRIIFWLFRSLPVKYQIRHSVQKTFSMSYTIHFHLLCVSRSSLESVFSLSVATYILQLLNCNPFVLQGPAGLGIGPGVIGGESDSPNGNFNYRNGTTFEASIFTCVPCKLLYNEAQHFVFSLNGL
jgi:hypothetical protein